jgi:hypothetical protein
MALMSRRDAASTVKHIAGNRRKSADPFVIHFRFVYDGRIL